MCSSKWKNILQSEEVSIFGFIYALNDQQLCRNITGFMLKRTFTFIAYEIWDTSGAPATKQMDYWVGFSSYICLRLSECLNPVFYNIGSSKMRKCTKNYLTSSRFLPCLPEPIKLTRKVASFSFASSHKKSMEA